jgi:Bacterial TSP3 repeat
MRKFLKAVTLAAVLALALLYPAVAAADPVWVGSVTWHVTGSSPYRDETSRLTQRADGSVLADVSWTTVWRYTESCLLVPSEKTETEHGYLTGLADGNGQQIGPIAVAVNPDGSYSIAPPEVISFVTWTTTDCLGTETRDGQWANRWTGVSAPPGSYAGDGRLHGSQPCPGGAIGAACSNRNGETSGWTGTVSWDLRLCDPAVDSDSDGLNDCAEAALGTDPHNPDTDGDGLSDGDEVGRGTDPLKADTDGDGLPDGDEVGRATDPLKADTDGDGLSDGDEVGRGTDPLKADTDGDGHSDGDEVARGTDPLDPNDPGQGGGDIVLAGTLSYSGILGPGQASAIGVDAALVTGPGAGRVSGICITSRWSATDDLAVATTLPMLWNGQLAEQWFTDSGSIDRTKPDKKGFFTKLYTETVTWTTCKAGTSLTFAAFPPANPIAIVHTGAFVRLKHTATLQVVLNGGSRLGSLELGASAKPGRYSWAKADAALISLP